MSSDILFSKFPRLAYADEARTAKIQQLEQFNRTWIEQELAPLKAQGVVSVTYHGIAPIPDRPILIRSQGQSPDRLLTQIGNHPLIDQALNIPDRNLDELIAINQRTTFDRIFVLDDLHPGIADRIESTGQVLPWHVSSVSPPILDHSLQVAGHIGKQVLSTSLQVGKAVLPVAAPVTAVVVLGVAGKILLTAMATAMLVDPQIIGVRLVPGETDIGGWWTLTKWDH